MDRQTTRQKMHELIDRMLTLDEHKKPDEEYGIQYSGHICGVTITKSIADSGEEYGRKTVFYNTAYFDWDNDYLEEIEKWLEQEEKDHDIIRD